MLSTDIRDAAHQFESRFDELSNSYLDKDFNIFWRLWKNKAHKKPHISHVAGDSDDACIAGAFAAHFSDSDCTTPMRDVFSCTNSQYGDKHKWFLTHTRWSRHCVH